MTRALYWLRLAVEFCSCALVAFIPFYVWVESVR
jgi:hypothetical protein